MIELSMRNILLVLVVLFLLYLFMSNCGCRVEGAYIPPKIDAAVGALELVAREGKSEAANAWRVAGSTTKGMAKGVGKAIDAVNQTESNIIGWLVG
jgi:hypothetical protein